MSARRVTVYDVANGKIVKRKGFEREAEAQALIANASGRSGYILYNTRIWKVRSTQTTSGRSAGRWYHSAAGGHSFSTYDPPSTWRACAAQLVGTMRERVARERRDLRAAERNLAHALKTRKAGPK